AELKHYPITLMASRIESWQAFEKIRAIGFDLYQGGFLAKPELLDTPKNSANRMLLVKLMTLLFDDKSSISKIEQVIEQEPTLFYRLLKFVNSAAYRLPNKIDSLHQAVIYIGTETLRTLVAILVWAKDDHKAYAVLPQILTRAKACELLAKEQGLAPADRYFTLGFLSLLDVALDQPLDKLIRNLSISEEMQKALLNDEGPLADVLNFVRRWEKADWKFLEQHKMFSLENTPLLMQQAQRWALETEKEMHNI
ncbi:MAG: HDOD domain-containing protein, partial [Oceanospirillum sp.]|nr:HDOD domain-containing protein [Oceanospirillum sp.]